MKKSLKAVLLCGIFISSSLVAFANDNDKELPNEPIENGFYMNEGCTKVDSITCYGFEGFSFVHTVTNDMLAYDQITYAFAVGSEEKSTFELNYMEIVEGRIFNAVVGKQQVIRIPLYGYHDNHEYTKYKNTLTGAHYIVRITGSIITGYKEKWDEATQSIKKTPIYKNTEILQERIPLTNRKHLKRSFLSYIPVIGFFVPVKKAPNAVKSNDCYPCEGKKPEIFTFDPSKY